jgi:hypothetical protein
MNYRANLENKNRFENCIINLIFYNTKTTMQLFFEIVSLLAVQYKYFFLLINTTDKCLLKALWECKTRRFNASASSIKYLTNNLSNFYFRGTSTSKVVKIMVDMTFFRY